MKSLNQKVVNADGVSIVKANFTSYQAARQNHIARFAFDNELILDSSIAVCILKQTPVVPKCVAVERASGSVTEVYFSPISVSSVDNASSLCFGSFKAAIFSRSSSVLV